MANDIIDINVYETVETVAITVNPNLTTVNINKVTGGGGGGSQDLQSVTDIGATTTNGIYINGITNDYGLVVETNSNNYPSIYVDNSATGINANGIEANALTGVTAKIYNQAGVGIRAEAVSGIPIIVYGNGNNTSSIDVNLGNTNKGLVINSGTSSTGNPIEVNKNGVNKLTVNQQGEITATKLIKQGGTSNQFLMADGSVSSGAGGATNLTTSQTASNFTINSDTGTDASVPLGNGTLAGATLNDYTTTEKNKLAAITGTNTGDQEIYWTKTGNDIKNNNTGNVEILGTKTAISNLAQGTIVSNLLTSSANNDVLVGLDVKSIFNTGSFTGSSKFLFRISDDTILRSVISWHGSQKWWLNDGTAEAGSIAYGTPTGRVGIIFLNNTSTGRSDIRHITTGGITIGSGTTGTIPPNQFWFYPTGNFAINQSTDAGYRLDVNGTTRLNGIVTATSSISANSFVKSGGTSSEILAADGSVITAGNNITITGGQISSVGGSGGGGSSVNYYLNGGTSQGTFGGTTYYEFSKTAIIGTGADFNRNTNGYIASFITDVADPSLLLIPAGNWNLEFFFSSSSAGGSPSFYAELYKYDGTTFTLITSGSAVPEGITNGTAIDAYFTALAVPETVLTVNDRLAIRVYVNASSKTITLHTQNGHICEVITTFTAGLTALNGLQAQVQNFAVGTTGTDFAINSSGSTHTFNLPTASASNRGALSSANWTTFNNKQDTLQNTVNIKSINGNSILGSGDLTISGTGISSLNGLTGATQTFSVTTNTGTGIPAWTSSGTNHQLNIPIAGGASTTGLITATSQFITGTKTFTSNPEIPVPAGNSGPCIVLGSTGGGGATGTLSIGDTVTYPNGVEMQRVKGVTSNIQTQLDSKASIVANITNDVYSGTIVWTGGAAPTIPNHTYSLFQVGNLVTLTINLAYTTAGSSLLTGVAMELPSTAPAPALPSSATTALDVINYGSGALQILNDSPTAAFANNTLLRIKSTGVYEVFITRGAGQYRHAYATIQYFV
jgi:hypothetical protein